MRIVVWAVVGLVAIAPADGAQQSGGKTEAASARSVAATRVEQGPAIDGDLAGDPVWQAAAPASEFWQEQPDEGQPSSEKTEVRIVYTADTLYVGVMCYDRDPGSIIVSDSRRDAPLDDTDSFRIIFDTYRDRLNGFVFGTNPAGIEYDGQVTNEGQGGGGLGASQRTQAGSGGGFNVNWDGAWQVRARITDIGWTAEFAIPFRTLRFPPGANQTWGINFQRNIRRRNERAYWAPIPRQYTLYRLSLAGSLTGLETPGIRNLKATPYVLGNILKSGDNPVATRLDRDAGKAGKYNVGLLNMQTAEYDDRLAGSNFSVVRISRDLANRSSIGALFTNRAGTGDLAPDGDSNRTYALDGQLGIRQHTVLSSFLAKTD